MSKGIKLFDENMYLIDGKLVQKREAVMMGLNDEIDKTSYKKTISYKILSAHNNTPEVEKDTKLKIRFDALASHDITYVGIIQTAKASGLEYFKLPYVLTNCHNSLCAVGGTINEDDHVFGLSAAKKYGGIYVPPHLAVIHTYIREKMSKCGNMILGSDSHTRYGALGTMAIGEGGPELVKQLLDRTYDINYPDIVAVYLDGRVRHGIGPQDVALAIIKEVFKNGFVKNKVMEFIGPGIANLPIEFRNGIDVMTTETTCLSSIWATDNTTREYFATHGRLDAYKEINPENYARYDRAVVVNLDEITAKIAMPFHPANVYDIKEVIKNPYDVFAQVEKEYEYLNKGDVNFTLQDKIVNGKVQVTQGVIAGCSGGTYDNIYTAANILDGKPIGHDDFALNIYPGSQPIYIDLVRKGIIEKLMMSGAIIKTAFCGPCFGAGDVPSNNGFSVRHTTRNFESREGSKPGEGQISSVALMDARSIAATALNNGILTSAEDVEFDDQIEKFNYSNEIYNTRVYDGYGKSEVEFDLKYGPNIKDWPNQIALTDNIAVKVVSVIKDPVTTTDELIPSGETSSYRSNPLRLAEFALSRKDPEYVNRAKLVKNEEQARQENKGSKEFEDIIKRANIKLDGSISYGSSIFANKPGDGSAREQAASSQRVLGGVANIAKEYATKRYRSNLINWGMLPFISDHDDYKVDDYLIIPNVKEKILRGDLKFDAILVRGTTIKNIELRIDELTKQEKEIIVAGCLMNYYKK